MHDQNTTAHALFYHQFDLIRPLYEKFIETQIMPLFDDDLCVQTVPTFRLSMPGGMAVQEFHRDGDYHHQASTVNFWLPLTRAFATNTVWIESEPDTGDFAPVNLDIGQYLEFDAIKLRHGNVPNETGVSRVSFDFRVIPRRHYHDTDLRTVTNDTRLALGSYYSLFRRPDHW